MAESVNEQLTRTIIRAVSRFETQKVIDLATDDIVISQPFAAMGLPERQQGKESFAAAINAIPSMFTSFKFEIANLYDIPDRDTVIFEMDSEGVFAINGAPYANRYIMIFGFREGKLSLWREYYNPHLLVEQMEPVMALMAEQGDGDNPTW